MKRQSKCEACMKIAKEDHSIHRLSKQYMYELLRKKCKHIQEEPRN